MAIAEKQQNMIGHAKGGGYVVRDHKDRHAVFLVESDEELFDPPDRYWIEAGEGFVAEQNTGLVHDGASKRGTAQHAPGQFSGQQMVDVAQADALESGMYPCANFRGPHRGMLAEGKGDIVEDI